MQCLKCGFDNPPAMKFCGDCGAPLQNLCSQCGFDNPSNFKFCGQCGANLQRQSSVAPHIDSPIPAGAEAERRQLTVLFCDLVGSTALSRRLDPEELHQVVGSYQAVGVAVINRFEGHVAQYLGDGLLVYFGYPAAHEDDAQRAVRTGLGLLEAVDRLSRRLQQEKGLALHVRIGIHTGRVVVGQVGSGRRYEQLALGDTPNIAARLQGLAAPDTVVISATTYRLVQGYFAWRDLGPQTLSGIAEPLRAYQVLGERRVQDRLQATAGLTPLIGREQELGLLLARWEQSKEGAGQVVALNGEGGIGKSRLIYALKDQLAQEPHLLLETQGSPYYKTSAFYPLIALLEQLLHFEPDDGPLQKLNKIEATLAQHSVFDRKSDASGAVPLLASLLAVPLGEDYAPSNLPSPRQKQLTLEILLMLLLDITRQQPVLFVMEDLHWVDPSTLEFLNLLIEQGFASRLLVLLTARPAFSPTWPARSHVTYLTLSRLSQKQVERMVEFVAGKMVPAGLLRQVIAKTDGVPLFVEELTKMVLELNLLKPVGDHYELASPLPALAIPTTLQDSLMARLDRLAPVKELAQLAATLGREFSYGLLQAVAGLDEATLQQSLARLVEAELLYQRGLPPQAVYTFKHALIQEAAYRSLLRSRRQQYHLKIAQTLAGRFPDVAERQPELLAHHFSVANLKDEAIDYWQRAGQRATTRSANLEAIEHLTRGLEIVDSLPSTPERLAQKLELQVLLGAPLLMTKGYASPEVERVYAQAWQLCRQLGDTPQRAPALFGLWVFYLVRADYHLATRLGEQLMAAAEQTQQPLALMEAHQVQGINQFYLGELTSAQTHLEQALARYNPEQGLQISYSGADTGVACLCHLALTLWLLGYPDQAATKIEAALTLAEALGHLFSQVFALSFAAWLHQYRGEAALAQARAEAAVARSTEQGFGLLLPFSIIFRGWGLVRQGHGEEGLAELRRGIEAYLATGAQLGRLYFIALLAEVYGQTGQRETGLQLLNEAIRVAAEKGERFYEAELYRLRGELLLEQNQIDVDLAEQSLQQALAIARRQGAVALELRAALHLSRRWAQQGQAEKGLRLLREVYDKFTEGFESPDLKQASLMLKGGEA